MLKRKDRNAIGRNLCILSQSLKGCACKLKSYITQDFSDGPAVKILSFLCRECRLLICLAHLWEPCVSGDEHPDQAHLWTTVRRRKGHIPPEADRNQETNARPYSLPFQYKRSLNSNSGKMVLWDMSPPSSWFAGFPNKVAIPCPNNSPLDLLACRAVSSTNLDLVTTGISPKDAPRKEAGKTNISEKRYWIQYFNRASGGPAWWSGG